MPNIRVSAILQARYGSVFRSAIIIVVFALLGLYTLHSSRASNFATAAEAESGILAGNVTTTADSAASGGTSVTFGSNTGGIATLNLPRVPWEGGPAYYSQFPQAKARGWTDPSFFPISVWYESVITQQDIDMDKDIGLNTYLELTGDSNMPLVRTNGMSAIHSNTTIANLGDETVGWLLADEPEQFGGNNQVLSYLQNKIAGYKSAHPGDGRMYYTNFTGNMSFPIYSPDDSTAAQWIDLNSAMSQDVYWYSRDLECGGSVAGEVWTNGSGAPQNNGNGYNDLSPAECHRAANYGYLIDHERYLDGLSGVRRPIFAFVENGHPFTDPSYTITPDQMAGAVWDSLIHEARGINYFNHSFGGSCQSSHNFRDPIISSRTCYTAVRAKAKEINGEIKQLAPVLNTQSYQYSFDPHLDTMLKSQGGSYYIFAMPGAVKGGSATGSHTLQLPAGLNGSTVDVMFENRSLPIAANRQFTDSFANEYTYHIYRITP